MLLSCLLRLIPLFHWSVSLVVQSPLIHFISPSLPLSHSLDRKQCYCFDWHEKLSLFVISCFSLGIHSFFAVKTWRQQEERGKTWKSCFISFFKSHVVSSGLKSRCQAYLSWHCLDHFLPLTPSNTSFLTLWVTAFWHDCDDLSSGLILPDLPFLKASKLKSIAFRFLFHFLFLSTSFISPDMSLVSDVFHASQSFPLLLHSQDYNSISRFQQKSKLPGFVLSLGFGLRNWR